MKTNLNYQAALKYLTKYHYSVIPVGADKKPLIKWQDFQQKLPSEADLLGWWSKWPKANVGIITGIISGLAVFDTDDDEADQAFNELMPESLHCPVVTTPRGGKHYYFKCSNPNINNKAMMQGLKFDFRGNGGYVVAVPSVNGNGKSYQFVDKCSIKDFPELPAIPDSLMSVLSYNTNSFSYVLKQQEPCQPANLFVEGRRDNDLFHIAHCLLKGGAKRVEAQQVLEIIAKSCQPPFPENEIKIKIQSALERKIRGEAGLTEEIKSIISEQNGIFSVSSVINQYQEDQNISNVSNSIKTQIRNILRRMKENGEIRHEKKAGEYSRVEDKCEDMDIINVSTQAHPLKLPLELRRWVKIMPKNLIICAGAKSSGKSAFLLNTAYLNKDHKEGVYYYNSEMAAEELRIRIDEFGEDYPLREWQKIRFKDRMADFASVVKNNPNAIHIIDFLEIYDNFYQVGELIRGIHDAMQQGVCIIALQKNASTKTNTVDLGLGGARSIEKARLYLAMDYGKIKIVDAKLFEVKGISPRGWVLDYKLVNGCKYIPDDRGWYDPSEKI